MNELGNAPIFVKIGEYKNIVNVLDLIKNKLTDARNNLNKINEIKTQEDSELKEWETSLNETEKKVEEINKVLFEQPT